MRESGTFGVGGGGDGSSLMHKSYTWEYQIEVAPYDKLMEVLEAFFASYPGGDYACERRERFRLQFRRGLWRKSLFGLGQLVPDRLATGEFSQWPTVVGVLARPAPTVFTVTLRCQKIGGHGNHSDLVFALFTPNDHQTVILFIGEIYHHALANGERRQFADNRDHIANPPAGLAETYVRSFVKASFQRVIDRDEQDVSLGM